ncbi:APC family permease [Chryseobacterium sp. ISL-6]|uniref:APC family permease n=1 Tax=Chryseobacterium sp. ISL-6 TaxID=2819143 RepID=UPI001BE5BFCF|nr:APC family permease [Chryseobacterium sp. ISL-6]MBT2620992.1 APC family permease [Chryseobacterium sp. ISL-6]
MELRIKPFPKNNYPKKGVLIKGSSPLVWFEEMDKLKIDLNLVKTFAIPSNEPNILYGCFIIFTDHAPLEIGKNSYFQCIDEILFIPENTTFYPKINPEDWHNIDSRFLVMHPEFGLVKLSEEIDWILVLEEPEKAKLSIRKPSNGVYIPQEIKSYTVEIDDEKMMESLQKSQTEEEWMKNLPFDMKKVMAGNKREIEKYLKYIEKYPDRAIDLGVPLDILGTSRGDGFGKFKFDNGWLSRLLGGGRGNGKPRDYRWVLLALWIVIIVGRIIIGFSKDTPETETPVSSGNVISKDALKNQDPGKLAFESGLTEIDMKIDSLYNDERRDLMKEYATAASKGPNAKEVAEVEKKVEKYRTKENKTRDFLKKIYNKKIAQHIESKSKDYQRKISDSIKKVNPNKPVNQGVVKSVWRKKQVLMEDSLGRLYGTLGNIEPHFSSDQNANTKKTSGSGDSSAKKISFSEIVWLVILIIGSVGLYSYFFRKKSLNIGGNNVPGGIKIFLVIVLVGMLIYLFYPLIEMYGYNWFVWLLVICVILLIYRLFSEDKTILKSDEDE